MLRIWRRDCVGLRHWKRVPMPPTRTIPPPPSHEESPHCPKDKNRSPFHVEKPLMITWFLGKKTASNFSKNVKLLPILYGRDVKFPVRVKWLILNMVSQLWADVKYHVPTGFFRRRREVFYVFVSVPQYLSTEAIKGVHCWLHRNMPKACPYVMAKS